MVLDDRVGRLERSRFRGVALLVLSVLGACGGLERNADDPRPPTAIAPPPSTEYALTPNPPTTLRRAVAAAESVVTAAESVVAAAPTTPITSPSPPATTRPPARSAAAPTTGVRPATVSPNTVTRQPAALRTFSMAFTGDNLLHSPVVRQALRNGGGTYDFAPMFERVRPILSAVDLAVCHIETPVAPAGEELSTYPLFGVPAESATGLAAAGYDRCSTASNHALDRGPKGVDATIGALEMAGLEQSGMARNPAEAIPQIFTVNGVKLAHLSFTFSFNGLRLPAGEPWRSNVIDVPLMIEQARDARSRGAEYVFLSIHWGTEGVIAPNPQQLDVARRLTESNQVDLIIGHHAHNLQPIEQVNGRWVVYGLGNVLSNMPAGPNWAPMSQDAAIVTVVVTEKRGGGFDTGRPTAVPTWCDRDRGFVIRPVVQDLADPTVSAAVKAALQTSLDRTKRIMGDFID